MSNELFDYLKNLDESVGSVISTDLNYLTFMKAAYKNNTRLAFYLCQLLGLVIDIKEDVNMSFNSENQEVSGYRAIPSFYQVHNILVPENESTILMFNKTSPNLMTIE